MSGPHCACRQVVYLPIEHTTGELTEAWQCAECGRRFVPVVPYRPPGAGDDGTLSVVLIDLIRWMAQTVHQGHHTDRPGTWRTCSRGFCTSVRHVLEENGVRPWP